MTNLSIWSCFFFFFTQRSTNIPWTVNLYFRFHLGLKVFYFFFLLLPLFLYMEIFLFSHKIHFHDSPNNKLHLEIDCCKNTIFQSSWTTKVRHPEKLYTVGKPQKLVTAIKPRFTVFSPFTLSTFLLSTTEWTPIWHAVFFFFLFFSYILFFYYT